MKCHVCQAELMKQPSYKGGGYVCENCEKCRELAEITRATDEILAKEFLASENAKLAVLKEGDMDPEIARIIVDMAEGTGRCVLHTMAAVSIKVTGRDAQKDGEDLYLLARRVLKL